MSATPSAKIFDPSRLSKMRIPTYTLSKCCALIFSALLLSSFASPADAQSNRGVFQRGPFQVRSSAQKGGLLQRHVAFQQRQATQKSVAEKQSVYLIGNSLTWDTLPGLLDGDVMWHVDCGKNLEYIYNNPTKPCVRTSVPWTKALREHKFEYLCVQPHFGTTVDRDSEVIAKWVEMQPQAKLVIHTGWTHHKNVRHHFAADCSDQKMKHSPAYFEMLAGRLKEKFPKLEIRSTGAFSVMHEICQDITSKKAPMQSIDTLYRDDIHVTTGAGRFLMHNLMRRALGQEISQQGFHVEEPLHSYLTSKLESADEHATRLTSRRK